MSKRQGRNDGLLFLAIGAGCVAEGYRLYATRDLRALSQELWPGFYVLILGATLLTAGVGRLVLSVAEPAGGTAAAPPLAGEFTRVVQAMAALAGYALLIGQVGYAAASFLFFAAAGTIFGIRSWPLRIALAFALAAAFTIVFERVLGVAFPRGALIEQFF